MSYARFALTLMVTHACNMRCTYCYTGEKAGRRMPCGVGEAAIRRAIASLGTGEGGAHLELGFFGGEPLLEAAAIGHWMDLARRETQRMGATVSFHLTTNGTVASGAAWDILVQPDLHLALSVDGLPSSHDRFRLFGDGRGSAHVVRGTMERLLAWPKAFSVVVVVRPETVSSLAEGIRHLRQLGVKSIEPSLDLWTRWTREDAVALRRAIAEAARLWAEGLPQHALNWFDEKAAELAGCETGTRCGFGAGELAVAPSGNLYPCERLIGEDPSHHPLRLPGHVLDGDGGFAAAVHPPGKQADACPGCIMHRQCNTGCRCSNFIRTGDIRKPDGLLCMLNQACLEEVASRLSPTPPRAADPLPIYQAMTPVS